jgi:uncharacterized protein YeaO (DUF488 family)
MIRVKRVYEPPAASDGARYLAERLWPRGMTKQALHLDGWSREAAPSATLRRWFSHDPAKWDEFVRRYRAELDEHAEAWQPLVAAARRGPVTLLFSARDEAHNSAVALQRYLEEKLLG